MTSDDNQEDATLVRVLSIVEMLGQGFIKPKLEVLRSRVNITKSHLDYLLAILFDKGYIDRITSSESYLLDEIRVSPQGSNFLNDYRNNANVFAHSAKGLGRDNKRDKLYDLISENRNLFWFAYYEGMLTKKGLNMFTDLLDMEMKHFSTESQKFGLICLTPVTELVNRSTHAHPLPGVLALITQCPFDILLRPNDLECVPQIKWNVGQDLDICMRNKGRSQCA